MERAGRTNGARCSAHIVGVMVTVDAVDHPNADAEEASGFPFVDPRLHEPGRGGMAQGVWCDVAR
jgi:hypothetical protein